jgi:exosortase A
MSSVLQRLSPAIPGVSTDGAQGGGAKRIAYVAAGVAAVAGLVALLHNTADAVIDTWSNSNTFNHGFLIVPICLYLAWRQRHAAATAQPAPDLRGLAPIVLAALAWLAGNASGTLVVQEFSLIVLIQSVILTMFGWPLCRAFGFPLLYLFLAVPVGEPLIPPLQAVTAYSAVEMLRAVGVPVFSDGNFISIPTGNFYVAEACAGERYLIGSIAIGVLFAGLMYRSWWRRGTFLVLSLIIPIVANGIRAFGIIFLAYVANNEMALGIDHVIYGWIFFSLVTFLVLAVGTTFRDAEEAAPRWVSAGPAARRPASIVFVVLAGVLALLPVAAAKAYGDHILDVQPQGRIDLAAPDLARSFAPLEGMVDPLAPKFSNTDAEMQTAYTVAGRPVYLHVGYYRYERRGAEVASSDQRLIDNPRWISSAVGTTSVMIGSQATAVQYARYVQGGRGRIVWVWYWVDGGFTGNPYWAKLLQAKVKLFGGAQPAAIIAVAADYGEVAADADSALRAFTAKLDPLLPELARAGAP